MCNALGTVRRVWRFKIDNIHLVCDLERRLYDIVELYQNYNVKFFIERTDEYVIFAVSIPISAEFEKVDLMYKIVERIKDIERLWTT